MSENKVNDKVLSKRIKRVDVNNDRCIICGLLDDKAHPPKDENLWLVLYDATIIKNFQPILGHYSTFVKSIPNIAYHENCRASFTNKKTLKDLKKLNSDDSSENSDRAQSGNVNFRDRPTHNFSKSSTCIYNKVCVFAIRQVNIRKGVILGNVLS